MVNKYNAQVCNCFDNLNRRSDGILISVNVCVWLCVWVFVWLCVSVCVTVCVTLLVCVCVCMCDVCVCNSKERNKWTYNGWDHFLGIHCSCILQGRVYIYKLANWQVFFFLSFLWCTCKRYFARSPPPTYTHHPHQKHKPVFFFTHSFVNLLK